MGIPGGECLRQREQRVQRPGGRSMLGVFEEQQGSECGWSKVSEGKTSADVVRKPTKQCLVSQ